jgi:hypothetical protein
MVRDMTRTMAAFALLAALAAPAAAADRTYSVTDFDRVVVEGPYVVTLVTGRPTSATASGSTDALDRMAIDVTGRTLRIRRNRTSWTGTPGGQAGIATVALTARDLRSVRLVGPASFTVDRVRGQRIELVVEGSGRLRATGIAADELQLGLVGSGRLELAGTAEILRADFQGTGDVAAGQLVADNATLLTTSVGEISLGARNTITVTANGLGTVTILGRPACTVRGAGADQVRCGGN